MAASHRKSGGRVRSRSLHRLLFGIVLVFLNTEAQKVRDKQILDRFFFHVAVCAASILSSILVLQAQLSLSCSTR